MSINIHQAKGKNDDWLINRYTIRQIKESLAITKVLVTQDLFNYSAKLSKGDTDSVPKKLSHLKKYITNSPDNGDSKVKEKNLTPQGIYELN